MNIILTIMLKGYSLVASTSWRNMASLLFASYLKHSFDFRFRLSGLLCRSLRNLYQRFGGTRYIHVQGSSRIVYGVTTQNSSIYIDIAFKSSNSNYFDCFNILFLRIITLHYSWWSCRWGETTSLTTVHPPDHKWAWKTMVEWYR
jgi:hypothetical protein